MQALSENIVWCFWNTSLSVPLFAQMSIFGNREFNTGDNLVMDKFPIYGAIEILLVILMLCLQPVLALAVNNP